MQTSHEASPDAGHDAGIVDPIPVLGLHRPHILEQVIRRACGEAGAHAAEEGEEGEEVALCMVWVLLWQGDKEEIDAECGEEEEAEQVRPDIAGLVFWYVRLRCSVIPTLMMRAYLVMEEE